MKPGSLTGDTFEKIAEFGKSTARQAGHAVKSVTVDVATGVVKELTGSDTATSDAKREKGVEKLEKGQSSNKNFTELDDGRLRTLDELHRKQELSQVRQRIEHHFRRAKEEEKRAIEEREEEETERKQAAEQEEMLKKKKEEEEEKAKHDGELGALPKGRERKSIFAVKRKVKAARPETRVGSGKQ